ncbi:DUF3267 domain-containing protein [Maribellus maritimus]|uniref:DUF3267 domain-containing protein n=1 Tax=Maribellus maritimus TaxID=2870838 RepID=UPI001EEC3F46|nr:DUF3267 domain-containing protein [Maribellus maritimus]MCG6191045.1 DUF3267 domain-containing protein [Maribellus maritimus]
MANPTIQELQNEDKFELLAKFNHQQIKDFVIQQLSNTNTKIVRWYMIYQTLMVLLGLFFLTRSVILAFQYNFLPLFFSIATLVFCVSVLIVIHELVHGIALKVTGAPKINYGGYLRKFVFYAEADEHVLNRKQFAFVALAPLVVIQFVTLFGILFSLNQSIFYFWIILMSAHSLFCAGDIGLLSLFSSDKNAEIYTFDVKEEKTSYYYKRIDKNV